MTWKDCAKKVHPEDQWRRRKKTLRSENDVTFNDVILPVA